MATWTSIPNAAVAAGGRPRGSVVTALRDNPVAITEAAAGAPRIVFAAIVAGVAGVTVGAVGTYGFFYSALTIVPGETVAGSNLQYAGAIVGISLDTGDNPAGSGVAGAATAPSGTWRCMGRTAPTSNGMVTALSVGSVFLRIA